MTDVTTIPLDIEDAGTWGSVLVPHPGEPVLVMSLPTRSHSIRFAVIDVTTGEVNVARGLSGELVDGVIDGKQATLLTDKAICYVTVLPRPQVERVVKPKGLGDSGGPLLRVRDGLLAIGGAKSTVFVDEHDGSVRKRLPIARPSSVRMASDETCEVLSFHTGEAVAVSLSTLKMTSRRPIPEGTCPVMTPKGTYMLSGPRARLRLSPAPSLSDHWRFKPRKVLELDPQGQRVRRSERIKRGARDVLGVSPAGIVLSTERGVRILSTDDLKRVAEIDVSDREVGAQAYVPAADAVATIPSPVRPTELRVVKL